MMLYAECELMEFLKSSEPHPFLAEFNTFKITDEARKAIEDIKQPKDLEAICADIKVCGRRELSELLKLRLRYINAIETANKEENERKRAEAAA